MSFLANENLIRAVSAASEAGGHEPGKKLSELIKRDQLRKHINLPIHFLLSLRLSHFFSRLYFYTSSLRKLAGEPSANARLGNDSLHRSSMRKWETNRTDEMWKFIKCNV